MPSSQSDYPRGAPFDTAAERASYRNRIGVLLGQRDVQLDALAYAIEVDNQRAEEIACEHLERLDGQIRNERHARDAFERRVLAEGGT